MARSEETRFSFTRIDTVPQLAMSHAVEEVDNEPDRQPTKKLLQVITGRLSIRTIQKITPRIGNKGTNGTRNERGRLDSSAARRSHPNKRSEGKESADVCQIGERANVGHHRDTADDNAGPNGSDMRGAESRMNARKVWR